MASFSVVSNIASTNAQANLSVSSLGLNKALNRLSSGFRINTSGDDAAGLAIANNYRSEQAILTQGIRNANDGLSVLNIKDGALNNVSLLIDRLATLASQASSAAGGVDLGKLEDEYNEVIDEIDREITVGGLDAAAGFSVFVSSEATAADGIIAGNIGAADTTTLGLNAASWTDSSRRADLARRDLGRHRHARRRAELGRYPAEPPDLRHLAGAVAGGQQEGRREPHPRRQHRGGVGEPDALQHPEPVRYRGSGAGEPVERVGPVAAAVIPQSREPGSKGRERRLPRPLPPFGPDFARQCPSKGSAGMPSVTLSGFNNIDFSAILEAVMVQERRAVHRARHQESGAAAAEHPARRPRRQALVACRAPPTALSSPDSLSVLTAASSDPAIVGVSTSSGSTAGVYDVVVNQRAKAQVTASTSTATENQVVTTGGTLSACSWVHSRPSTSSRPAA